MKIINYLNTLLILFILLLSFSCSDDKVDPKTSNKEENITGEEAVNNWIYGIMDEWYLWYDEMPQSSTLNYLSNSQEFYKSLLIKSKDGVTINNTFYYFSTLEETKATKATSENSTYGIYYVDYNDEANNRHYFQILYVIPNSPADKSDLKRGDIIYEINDKPITASDNLLSGSAVSLTLVDSHINVVNKIYFTKRADKIALGSSEDMNDVIIKDTIIDKGEKKIAYLVYNSFETGRNNEDNAYNTHLCKIFKGFKDGGVNEMVLDLRYNGGGRLTCALMLASMLAPEQDLNNEGEFARLKYNDKKTTSIFGSSAINYYSDKFDKNYYSASSKTYNYTNSDGANLNLKRLYVLVGGNTASASELIINGLKPYYDVTIIGTKTIGKNVGSNEYTNSTKTWKMHPITFDIYNKNMENDYDDGFIPDIEVDELDPNFINVIDFGDANEPLLKAAIEKIMGTYKAIKDTKSTSLAKNSNIKVVGTSSPIKSLLVNDCKRK